MGLFQKNKLTLEKIKNEDGFLYFIDYHKLTNPNGFLMDFIQDFIEEKNSLLVINTDNFYEKNRTVLENKINELKEVLDKKSINYNAVVTQKEADNKLFGIKIDKPTKVNQYHLGIGVTPDMLRKVTEIVKDYNFCYYAEEDKDIEKLIKQFQDIRGNYEELDKGSSFYLYNDCYFWRIRICSREDIIQQIEAKLQKYSSRT